MSHTTKLFATIYKPMHIECNFTFITFYRRSIISFPIDVPCAPEANCVSAHQSHIRRVVRLFFDAISRMTKALRGEGGLVHGPDQHSICFTWKMLIGHQSAHTHGVWKMRQKCIRVG